ETAIVVESVGKRFGSLWALRSVDFHVPVGTRLTLFGPNGAGKSTLLRILATIIRSYQGRVMILGVDIRKRADECRSAIGFLSHETFLYQDLTAAENLFFYSRLYRIPRREERCHELLDRVGLSDKRDALVRHLSRGMKQRLSLARVLLHRPRILLLDEPYTGLDEAAAITLSSTLAALRREGGTVIMASHSLERGLEGADRVIVIDRGEVVYDRSAEELDKEAFRRYYHGTVGVGEDA
ncbi:MAG: heme ABC exporter ATP-binding protein CcmA, partial [Anaerolineae bacterium]